MNILLVAEGCLMMQFRNNAVYAVAVFMLLLLILRPKKEKLGILILGICLVLGETGMRNVIQTAIGSPVEAPKIEAYSVPIQAVLPEWRYLWWRGTGGQDPGRWRHCAKK